MIVILGIAGAGKTTQCQRLEQRGGFQWFSVGQLLRDHDDEAQKAEMAHGKVLSDEIVTPLVREELARRTDVPELLLDGCPRTVGQAAWLATAHETPAVRMVIHFVADDETAFYRLQKRQREDDSEEAVRARFQGYHRDIQPVLSEFTKRNIPVIDIDAVRDEDDVFRDLIHIVGAER